MTISNHQGCKSGVEVVCYEGNITILFILENMGLGITAYTSSMNDEPIEIKLLLYMSDIF